MDGLSTGELVRLIERDTGRGITLKSVDRHVTARVFDATVPSDGTGRHRLFAACDVAAALGFYGLIASGHGREQALGVARALRGYSDQGLKRELDAGRTWIAVVGTQVSGLLTSDQVQQVMRRHFDKIVAAERSGNPLQSPFAVDAGRNFAVAVIAIAEAKRQRAKESGSHPRVANVHRARPANRVNRGLHQPAAEAVGA